MRIEKRKIKDLKASEYNPRQSTQAQEEHLNKSLEKFGCVEPIVINSHEGRENIIIGGHFRVRELKKLGEEEVPHYVDIIIQRWENITNKKAIKIN